MTADEIRELIPPAEARSALLHSLADDARALMDRISGASLQISLAAYETGRSPGTVVVSLARAADGIGANWRWLCGVANAAGQDVLNLRADLERAEAAEAEAP